MTKINTEIKKPQPVVSKGTKKPRKSSDDGFGWTCCKVIHLVVMVFGLTALYLYNYQVNNSYFYFTKGSQFRISNMADNFYKTLCQQYDVDAGEPADMFLVSGKPEIEKSALEVNSFTANEFVNKYNYAYYATHLLEGSRILVKGCRIFNTLTAAEMLIIKGDKDWAKFKKGECPRCAKKSVSILEREQCDFGWAFDLEYAVSSSDNYYIVLTQTGRRNRGDVGTYVYSRVTLFQTYYNMDVREACWDKSTCRFNLTMGSDEDIVVSFRAPSTRIGSLAFINTTCDLRVMFWVGIFAIFPSSLILLLCLCGCLCCSVEKKAKRESKKKEIKQQLIDNHRHSVNLSPPSYEAVSDPLPSYDSLA